MPPVVFIALNAIQAAITAFPQVKAIVLKGKEFITSLFTAGAITKAQQDALHQHIDDISEAIQRGEIPEGWDVEADPGA